MNQPTQLTLDPVEAIFREVVEMSHNPNKPYEDPYQSEEYQRFVDSMFHECHCKESNRPCDGVMVGGLCDGIEEEPERYEDEEEEENYEQKS